VPRRRLPALVAPLAAATVLLSSCSLLGGGRSARDEADDLAAALSSGKPGTLSYAGGTSAEAQQLWDRAVASMDASKPRVRVEQVTEGSDGRPSTARLAWSWDVAGTDEAWTYRSTAELDPVEDGTGDDGWRVRLLPTLVHPDLTEGARLRRSSVVAKRADITGAGGAVLVTDRPVSRIGIDKSSIGAARQAAAARALARRVHVDPQGFAARVAAAGPRAFVEAIVLRGADARRAVAAGVARLPGVRVVADTLPLAPTREFARPVLGTVGPVTAEMVAKSGGAYAVGDEAGLSGLQARYDEQLRGTPGVTVDAVAADGATRTLFGVDPVPGRPLRTTLAPRLQEVAERALADVRPASAVVAIRPSTGDLLAMASGPGGGGLSTATVGRYAPGSTFKVVSSLALLRSGLTPSSTVGCPATTVVDGKRFKNYSDYPAGALGRISFATAVANSCNTAFVGQRGAVSQADIARAAAALGIGVDHDLGFPAFLGSVPATEAAAGSATGHAASMIGQGRVLASPMAMATVAASVARGSTVVPRLLPAADTQAADPGDPLTGEEARRLRTLMRGVVTQGSGSFLASLPGAPVLAKTGTAEFGTSVPLQTHAWMIAVHGDLAVAVFVDVGQSGSGTAGPILERFLRAAG
jgi:cell division protein FtsI/penicillin-binding protein 2